MMQYNIREWAHAYTRKGREKLLRIKRGKSKDILRKAT